VRAGPGREHSAAASVLSARAGGLLHGQPHADSENAALNHCPARGPDHRGQTHYLAFVGPGTAFEREGLTIRDFPDGLSNTVLVAEASESVTWSQPRDLEYGRGKPLSNLGVTRGGGVPEPGTACSAAFADGTVRTFDNRMDAATLRAVITRNGGERVDPSKLE
jgi:hypothetical protein